MALKGVKKNPEKDKFRLDRAREGRPYQEKWYKALTVNDHPNRRKNGTIDEHRYLAAKALGKPLPLKAVVHHHNGGYHGGALVICEDGNYHKLLHVRQRAYEATGDAAKRKCPLRKQWENICNMKKHSRGGESYYHPSCQLNYQRNWVKREQLLGS